MAPHRHHPARRPRRELPLLPGWALDRIRTDLIDPDPTSGRPGTLWRVDFTPTDPHTPALPAGGTPAALLAELDPAVLRGSDAPDETAATDGRPGFFHRAHRRLPAGGLLLLATRQQRRADGSLLDATGTLTAAARAAGFTYLQHIVVAECLPCPCPAAGPRHPGDRHVLVHTDLLAMLR